MEADSTCLTTTSRKKLLVSDRKRNSDEGTSTNSLFPCENPTTPHMASFQARIRTFISWPCQLVAATAVVIAKAGFFYLQERDRVKCYYCNGGLQNWKRDDDPWFEHAKWFPHCEHVLHCKGLEYVEEIGRRFPDLKRPSMPGGSSQSAQPMTHENKINASANEASPSIFSSELSQFLESKVAKDVEILGFSKESIAEAATRRYKSTKSWFSDASDLISTVIVLEDESKQTENSVVVQLKNLHLNEEGHSSSENVSQQISHQTTIVPVDKARSLKQKVVKSPNRQDVDLSDRLFSLRQENLCKICLDRQIDCVLLKCRHMCCCVECAASIKHCPICREKLVSIFKFYR